jgi:hypothetical protein
LNYTDISELRTVSIIRTMMVAERASETSVYFNETTRRYTPEGCHLHFFMHVFNAFPFLASFTIVRLAR